MTLFQAVEFADFTHSLGGDGKAIVKRLVRAL